jgi:cytochrome c oxidase subunit 3
MNVDVAALPRHAFGPRAPIWWGAVLLVVIEGTMMGLLLVSYFYLRGNFQVWPPSGLGPRVFWLAMLEAALLAVSLVPIALASGAAQRGQLGRARRLLLTGTLLGGAMLILRGIEIGSLPFRWDTNAYGSVFWMILILHTTHVLSGAAENAVLLAVLWRGSSEPKHLGDVETSAILWYFVVLEWLAAFAILYFEPILLPR